MKIPFALREGKVVCISDLSIAERGLKCKCNCVSCEAPLIARMGNINEHHFAHSEKLCDEGQAYILGMYMLAKELLDKCRKIVLPDLKVAYHHSITPITLDNIKSFIKIIPQNTEEREDCNYILISNQVSIPIEETYLKYKDNKTIDVLIIKTHGKELALKIALPDTICKDYSSKPYKGLSTLEIDFRTDDYNLNALTKGIVEKIIVDQFANKRWISNLKISKVYSKIITENNQYIEEYKVKQEEYLKSLKCRRMQIQQHSNTISTSNFNNKLLINTKSELSSAEQYKIAHAEVLKFFDKDSIDIIRDQFGWRWVYCTLCNQIKREDEMGIYGGNLPNLGKCSECFR